LSDIGASAPNRQATTPRREGKDDSLGDGFGAIPSRAVFCKVSTGMASARMKTLLSAPSRNARFRSSERAPPSAIGAAHDPRKKKRPCKVLQLAPDSFVNSLIAPCARRTKPKRWKLERRGHGVPAWPARKFHWTGAGDAFWHKHDPLAAFAVTDCPGTREEISANSIASAPSRQEPYMLDRCTRTRLGDCCLRRHMSLCGEG